MGDVIDKQATPNFKDSIVLIVDDNITNLDVLFSCLEDYGFTILVATDGESALERAEYVHPDIILLDILLPDIDGFETCRRLKTIEALKDVPVIFMTALTETADKVKGFQTGAVDYITKPLQKDEMLARIVTHLRLRELTERLEQKVQERTREIISINQQLQEEINERKRTEEQLSYQANLLKNVSDAVISVDMNHIIQSWNKAAEKMYGWTAIEAMGQSLRRLINPQYPAGSWDEMLQAVKESGHYEGEVIHHCQDGTPLNILGCVSTIKDSIGNVVGLVTVNHDITDRKQDEEKLKAYSERLEEMVEDRTKKLWDAEERLIRRERLAVLGQLAASVGHELRNPLGVISNAIYFLRMVLTEADETVKEYLDMIHNRVQEAEKIVSDLLNLSRNRIPDREKIILNHIITDVLGRHPAPIEISVVNQIPADLPLVFVDSQQMRQVLTNLITNAYQAMPKGGQLILSALTEQQQVHLSIADTGYGMASETMAKIFEPLFTTKAKGIGLGLVVSRNLVEINEGNLAVESVEGQGTTFTITMPT